MNMDELRDFVSISGAAKMIGMSRTRFNELVGTIFPLPNRDEKGRPYFTREQQKIILYVHHNNVGINGQIIFFRAGRHKKKNVKISGKPKLPPLNLQPRLPAERKKISKSEMVTKTFKGVNCGDQEKILFAQFIEEQNIKDSTTRAIHKDLRRFMIWINKHKYKSFSSKDIVTQDFVDFQVFSIGQSGLSYSTVNRNVVLVRKFFNWLVEKGELNSNPAKFVKEMRGRTKIKPKLLDKEEINKLLLEAKARGDTRSSAIFHVLIDTGCLSSELVELKLSDLDVSSGLIKIVFCNKKGANIVALNSESSRALAAWLDVRPPTLSDKVFIGIRGPLTSGGVNKLLSNYSKFMGFSINPRSIRKTKIGGAECKNKGFVYVICENQESGPTKIGLSNSPSKRMPALQTGNPRKLKMVAKFKCENMTSFERLMHRHFAKRHLNGEWFDVAPNEAVEAVKNYLELILK
jgi:site-specific recombinase XerD